MDARIRLMVVVGAVSGLGSDTGRLEGCGAELVDEFEFILDV